MRKFQYKKRERKVLELRPELLTHPNVPKPLHNTNPRTILGDSWWNDVKAKAKRLSEYTCYACGKLAEQDKFEKRWLHAHESYKVDYNKTLVTYEETVALCYSCHMFIHSGRLYSVYQKGEVTYDEIKYILERGLLILNNSKLETFVGTLAVCRELGILDAYEPRKLGIDKEVNTIVEAEIGKWSDWRMSIQGKLYKGKFKTFKEWEDYYS